MTLYNAPDKNAGDQWSSAEHNQLKAAHNSLCTDLTQEVADRIAGDVANAANITSNTNNLAAEVAARIAGDNVNAADITANSLEITDNAADIVAERNRAMGVETSLTTQIADLDPDSDKGTIDATTFDASTDLPAADKGDYLRVTVPGTITVNGVSYTVPVNSIIKATADGTAANDQTKWQVIVAGSGGNLDVVLGQGGSLTQNRTSTFGGFDWDLDNVGQLTIDADDVEVTTDRWTVNSTQGEYYLGNGAGANLPNDHDINTQTTYSSLGVDELTGEIITMNRLSSFEVRRSYNLTTSQTITADSDLYSAADVVDLTMGTQSYGTNSITLDGANALTFGKTGAYDITFSANLTETVSGGNSANFSIYLGRTTPTGLLHQARTSIGVDEDRVVTLHYGGKFDDGDKIDFRVSSTNTSECMLSGFTVKVRPMNLNN